MFFTNYLIGVALILSPCDTMCENTGLSRTELIPVLRHIGLQWEILDHRECDDFFHDSHSLRHIALQLNNRYWDLQSAPRLCDCARFPNRTYAGRRMATNRIFAHDIRNQIGDTKLDDRYLCTVLEETSRLYEVWSAVKDAQHKGFYVTARRSALRRLRDLIGWQAYYRGELPPCVPIWRIPEARP